jgi:hypothetical protein
MYRISQGERDPAVDVDTVDEIVTAVRSLKPGLYHIGQAMGNSTRADMPRRSWGFAAKQTSGMIVLTINP